MSEKFRIDLGYDPLFASASFTTRSDASVVVYDTTTQAFFYTGSYGGGGEGGGNTGSFTGSFTGSISGSVSEVTVRSVGFNTYYPVTLNENAGTSDLLQDPVDFKYNPSLDTLIVDGTISASNFISVGTVAGTKVTGSFTGSFTGDGSELTGVSGIFPFTGSAAISGTLSVEGEAGHITSSGNISASGTGSFGNLDINGAIQLDGTFTVGANDQGYDVTLFGDTSNRRVLWDTSADHLKLFDDTKLVFGTGANDADFDASIYWNQTDLVIDSESDLQLLSDVNVTGALTASSDISASGGTITGLNYINNGVVANSKITGSFTGSFTGDLTGTSSHATNADDASSASFATVAAGLVHTPNISIGTLTNASTVAGSKITGSFTGSFTGDGSELTGVSGIFPFTGSAAISGTLSVEGEAGHITASGDISASGDIIGATGSYHYLNLQPSGSTSPSIFFNTSAGPDFTLGFIGNNTLSLQGSTGAAAQSFALDSKVENFDIREGGTIHMQYGVTTGSKHGGGLWIDAQGGASSNNRATQFTADSNGPRLLNTSYGGTGTHGTFKFINGGNVQNDVDSGSFTVAEFGPTSSAHFSFYVPTKVSSSLTVTGSVNVSGSISASGDLTAHSASFTGPVKISLATGGTAFEITEEDEDQRGRLLFEYDEGDPTLTIASRDATAKLHIRQEAGTNGLYFDEDGQIYVNNSNLDGVKIEGTNFHSVGTNANALDLGKNNRPWKDLYLTGDGANIFFQDNLDGPELTLKYPYNSNRLILSASDGRPSASFEVLGDITNTGTVANSSLTGSFTGSFTGDGSGLSGVSAGFPFTGSAAISGTLSLDGEAGHITSSGNISSSGGTITALNYQNTGTVAASDITGSFTGSFTGDLTGTSSHATNADDASSASFATVAAGLVHTPDISIGTLTNASTVASSNITGSFTGSFSGSYFGSISNVAVSALASAATFPIVFSNTDDPATLHRLSNQAHFGFNPGTNTTFISGSLVTTGSILLSGSIVNNETTIANTKLTGSFTGSHRGTFRGTGPNLTQIGTTVGGTSITGSLTGSFTGDIGTIASDTGSQGSTALGFASGQIAYFGGGGTTTAGAVVVLKSTGKWEYSNATSDSASTGSLGIALGANTATHGVLMNGFTKILMLNNGNNGAIGDPVYLENVNGRANIGPPTTDGNIVRIIGHLISGSTDGGSAMIHFNPSPDFIEHA